MHPDKLSYSADGVLYHWSPVGGRGRIVSQVAMELSRYIEPWGPYFAYRDERRHTRVPLMPIALTDVISMIRPNRENACIGCGGANPWSLGLSFVNDNRTNTISTYVRPDERMQGSFGIVHGGFVSLLLDETMGKCLSALSIKAPTVQLNVTFRRPMELGREYEVRSWIDVQDGRKNHVRGLIVNTADQSVVAEAHALFLTLRSSSPS